MSYPFIIAGIGTGVGKTVAASILTHLTQGTYWKPIETGIQEESDTKTVKTLLQGSTCTILDPIYSLKAPTAPLFASKKENIEITEFLPPQGKTPLIIEMCGGIFVPINRNLTTVELIKPWHGKWILVSKNYLGSINHTLLTAYALKELAIHCLGIIINGPPNEETELFLENKTKLPILSRIFPESIITPEVVQRYSKTWKNSHLLDLLKH